MPPKASTDLQFTDASESETLLKRVRSDADELAWVIFKYATNSDNLLEVHASGNGGLDEFRSSFDPKERMYGLLRLVDYYDGHATVKFVFVPWAGVSVGVIKKARMATHKGSIVNLIGQSHVSIDASEESDISDSVVLQRVSDASGSGNRVLEGRPASDAPARSAPAQQPQQPKAEQPREVKPPVERAQPASNGNSAPKQVSSRGPSVPRAVSTSELSFANEEEGAAAIKRVRNDDDAADWVLFGYEGESNVVVLENIGNSGLEELKQNLKPGTVQYGLLRVYDFYDGHRTTKFVLILWISESVKIMRKARIATHKGAITEFFGQYHVDVPCSNLNEITEEIVMTAVKQASGTADHVKS